jgi:hypothetical protein
MYSKNDQYIFSLVDKHSVSEYSFYLQYLMQPNVISDVETIIHKALSLERTSQQHFKSCFDSEYNRLMAKDLSKSTSSGMNSQYSFIDSSGNNSPALFISSSQYSKLTSSDGSKENEMAV